jgi:hypothetical protein
LRRKKRGRLPHMVQTPAIPQRLKVTTGYATILTEMTNG